MKSAVCTRAQLMPANTVNASKMASTVTAFRQGVSIRTRAQLKPLHRSRVQSAAGIVCKGPVIDATAETFESEVMTADVPVLVDFWATWCGPCKLVAPSVEHVAKTFEGQLKVIKVDGTNDKQLLEKYKVYGLPCIVVFKGGKEVEGSHREGAITRKDLMKYVEQHVGLTAAV